MKKYSNVKKWYDKTLKSRSGEVLIVDGYGFNITDTDDFYRWVDESPRTIFKEKNMFNNSVEGELLYSYMAKNIGLNAVTVRPALYFNGQDDYQGASCVEGVIVEDFVENRVKTMEILSSEFQNIKSSKSSIFLQLQGLKNLSSELKEKYLNCYINYAKIKKSLQKMFLLDFFTYQVDRHCANIAYTITLNKGKVSVELAKIFDNSMIFYLSNMNEFYTLERMLLEGNEKNFYKNADNVYKTYFVDENPDELDEQISQSKYLTKKIANLILHDKNYQNIYNNIKKLNLNEVISQIQQEIDGYKFPEEKLNIVKMLFSHRINKVEKQIKKLQEKAVSKGAKNEDICVF